MYGTFLSECFFGYTPEENAFRKLNAQGDPCPGKQSGISEKAKQVADKLREMKLSAAAKKVEDGIEETLTYMNFPTEHWRKIRTNNAMERVNREIKRRTKAIGAFPDGASALMLVCARLVMLQTAVGATRIT